MERTLMYCIDCDKEVEGEHNTSHNVITLEGYYTNLVAKYKKRHKELMNNSLECARFELNDITEIINVKESILTNSLESLRGIKEKLKEKEKDINAKTKKFKESIDKVEFKEDVDKLNFDYPIEEIIALKNRVKKISSDINLQHIAEALILSYMIESGNIMLAMIDKKSKCNCLHDNFYRVKDSQAILRNEDIIGGSKKSNKAIKETKDPFAEPLTNTFDEINKGLQEIVKDQDMLNNEILSFLSASKLESGNNTLFLNKRSDVAINKEDKQFILKHMESLIKSINMRPNENKKEMLELLENINNYIKMTPEEATPSIPRSVIIEDKGPKVKDIVGRNLKLANTSSTQQKNAQTTSKNYSKKT